MPGGAGGSRTRTDITVQRILSPQRLPFRHRPAQRVSLGEERVDKKADSKLAQAISLVVWGSQILEATAGFEPAIGVLQTPALATWLRRQEKTTPA